MMKYSHPIHLKELSVRRLSWAFLPMMWFCLPIVAQEQASLSSSPDAMTSTSLIGIGTTRILDTYITPEQFSGTGFSYLNIREHTKDNRRWCTVIEHELDISSTDDRSGNITMLEGGYNLYWGYYHKWNLLANRLHLQTGGVLNACMGFLYDMTASNNPAQARAAVNIMPSAITTYDLTLWQQLFSIRYELNLPLIGVMFSPNYGQSYYEIFSLGNYDHNIVPTTCVCAPTIRQQITLDWQASKRWTVRVGYLGNYQQAAVNNLKQHVYTHRLLIGVVRHLAR